ncbi:signal recognition particle-docking protein FtsY [Paraburkholderia phymatum]|uniref:Signal recognition particle receptor FtsY n=1 Tax=Paraburkholderia phymatum (strain DSM 17167 / CIP 108236 / LMG 21445 / STM815) TaxID=391038 RepID=B2JCD7_PARP8|nr:signal recognition particle-docking protein FtsY [Paraburkholderia phymatum]ACC69501.1 signal recognition particle-docking protein FtsY [Paraburkholderia phymatum STM815]
MFSFFKRFKGSKAPDDTPEASQTERGADLDMQDLAEPAAPAAARPQALPDSADAPEFDPDYVPDAADFEDADKEADESDANVEIVPPPVPEAAARRSWLTRLRSGLSKTSSSITGIFVGTRIDEDLYEELETALLMSDAGVDATEYLLETLREKVRSERLTDPQQVKSALRTLLVDLLKPLEKSLTLGHYHPTVMMIAGVNGAGKTTSIGKLAKHMQRFNQSVLLAAGDTFRAAAREQLAIWGERNNVMVVQQESGDPAAVIFDAVGAARARKINVVMADTAGRLPTQLHLMEELRKVKRVIGKAMAGAPHEVLLVIDANTGQNALAQVKAFDDALGLTGLIVTKLDGTAKGGILAAIARQRPVPVYFIGVGEKVEDLQPFSAEEFSDALLG